MEWFKDTKLYLLLLVIGGVLYHLLFRLTGKENDTASEAEKGIQKEIDKYYKRKEDLLKEYDSITEPNDERFRRKIDSIKNKRKKVNKRIKELNDAQRKQKLDSI